MHVEFAINFPDWLVAIVAAAMTITAILSTAKTIYTFRLARLKSEVKLRAQMKADQDALEEN